MEFDIIQTTCISGMTWTPKRIIADDRGAVLLMLKDRQFEFEVGEIYFSIVKPGKIKGWKFHREMWQRFAVPVGWVKIVAVDLRNNSSSEGKICEIEIGAANYGVITIPAGLWYSFKCISEGPSLIVNAASISRKTNESESVELADFRHYSW